MAKPKKRPPDQEEPSNVSFTRFEQLARRIVVVPKQEVDALREEERAKKDRER